MGEDLHAPLPPALGDSPTRCTPRGPERARTRLTEAPGSRARAVVYGTNMETPAVVNLFLAFKLCRCPLGDGLYRSRRCGGDGVQRRERSAASITWPPVFEAVRASGSCFSAPSMESLE